MFRRKTTFVLGAGASFELGFPLGGQLAEKIAEGMSLNLRDFEPKGPAVDLLIELNSVKPRQDGALIRLAQEFQKGILYSNSIDDFLDQNQNQPDVIFLGKLAIVREILAAERGSKLKISKPGSDDYDSDELESTWPLLLARMLLRGVRKDNVKDVFGNVRFVSFNYDRSLERFLAQAISDSLAIKRDEAWQIIGTAEILHAYGSLGHLPGQSGQGALPYGTNPTGRLLPIAERIITYTESVADEALINRIHSAMAWAEQIVFLGFGFHNQNMELLRPHDGVTAERVVATTKGLSLVDENTVRDRIERLYPPIPASKFRSRINLHDEGCADILRTYQLTLPS